MEGLKEFEGYVASCEVTKRKVKLDFDLHPVNRTPLDSYNPKFSLRLRDRG